MIITYSKQHEFSARTDVKPSKEKKENITNLQDSRVSLDLKKRKTNTELDYYFNFKLIKIYIKYLF